MPDCELLPRCPFCGQNALDTRELEDNMPNQKRIFKISGNNKGLVCPLFKAIVCQQGYCHECQIYLDWQKGGQIIVVCAWCGKGQGTKPAGLGQSGVSHGICPECRKKHFPKVKVS